MTYPQAAGFLFAVACSPELIRPSEWLPCILGDEEAPKAEMEDLQDILPALFGNDLKEILEKHPDESPPDPHPTRNGPCPCGSGKKYKRCCGR